MPGSSQQPRCSPLAAFAVAVVFVCLVSAATFVYAKLTAPHYGSASEVVLDGSPTGVFRLTVITGGSRVASGNDAQVAASDYDGPLTADQEQSFTEGWQAACLSQMSFGMVSRDEAFRCSVARERPLVATSGPTFGPSAGLANALAFFDWSFDITGDLRVAATGDIVNDVAAFDDTGASVFRSSVTGVGGISEKVEAAIAADVDLLLVPSDNLADVELRRADLDAAGIPVFAVDDLDVAVRLVCEASGTDVCRRILTG